MTVNAAGGVEAPEAAPHCGTVAIVGRPNVGKSTLLNALVGQKVSITSRKAQTTRHRITGIRSLGEPDCGTQFVFVDTPGFQTRHATALNKSLNRTVQSVISGVDVIVLVVEAGKWGAADQLVLDLVARSAKAEETPVVLLANKLDEVTERASLAPWLQSVAQHHPFAQIVPLSARRAPDVQRLLGILAPYLPAQAWWFDADALTDKSEKFLAAEIIREKLFRLTGDEVPYTSTVVIDQFVEEAAPVKPARPGGSPVVPRAPMRRIAATIIVEREAHKAMVIGAGGERLKRIGTEARQEMEALFDAKVFLECWVKVRSGWADDEARVRSYGYD